MKTALHIFLVFFGLTLFSNLTAQTEDKKARKLYEEGKDLIEKYRKFEAGIRLLQAAVERDPEYLDAHLKLGATYKTLNMRNVYVSELKHHFGKVAELKPDNGGYVSVYYDLAKIYHKEGSYSIAKNFTNKINKYPEANKRITKQTIFLNEQLDFALEGIKNPLDFDPLRMPTESINRFAFNSHPVLTADQKQMVISVRNGIGNIDENIVVSNYENGAWQESDNISTNVNTPRNEGMATISGDGKTLVFTSCHRKDSYGGCDLYISTKTGEKWSIPENIGSKINSHAKESEPSLSADGRTLYFSSIRKSGFGLSDIYSSKLGDDNVWGESRNLGDSINTKGNEVTPFIHADGEHLYFASDKHLGFGGYDVFVSLISDTVISAPINIGYPLNTASNEGSLYITPDYTKGYFEKYEKQGSESRSLIYTFDFPDKIKSHFVCTYSTGKVYDAVTKKPLKATVELTNINSDKRSQLVQSDSLDGNYLLVLKEGEEYAMHVEKQGYMFYSSNLDFRDKTSFDPLALDIYLNPISKTGTMALSNIFYATDKFELDKKSKTELGKLIKLMNDNPSVKIEIGGHTDNQGSVSYNKTLSSNRAKAVYEYLITNNIVNNRMKFFGYGSAKPIASNSNEEGMKQNRRIEVKFW